MKEMTNEKMISIEGGARTCQEIIYETVMILAGLIEPWGGKSMSHYEAKLEYYTNKCGSGN